MISQATRYRILCAVAAGYNTQTTLAKLLGVTPSRISQLISPMVEDGTLIKQRQRTMGWYTWKSERRPQTVTGPIVYIIRPHPERLEDE